jgi:hypothetical protein
MGKRERLGAKKRAELVAMETEHGSKDASPTAFRGLPRISKNISISFVLIHFSVKEQRL